MSTFDHLQRKRGTSSTRAALASHWLRSSRPFAPLPTAAAEQVPPVTQEQLEHAARFGHSFERISILPPEQKNMTGLPDNLKVGVETLSGQSMDDVQVHYNSSKPAQVQALAYTQGTEIHVSPGQEKHLAHEAWHVVQQKQGRVRTIRQERGVAINDEELLEQEAEQRGVQATAWKQRGGRRTSNGEQHGAKRSSASPLNLLLPLVRPAIPIPRGREAVVQRYIYKRSESSEYWQSAQELQTENPEWYQKLTEEQKKEVDLIANSDMLIVSIEDAIAIAQEITPASGARKTVLGGGYPRDPGALKDIINAYQKSHNLTVYDIENKQLLSTFTRTLQQENIRPQDIDFQFGKPLSQRGRVQNHDFIIPHPGPFWIGGMRGGERLAESLMAVLGPGSVAYILTDTTEDQVTDLEASLKPYAGALEWNVQKAVIQDPHEPTRYIVLGGVKIPLAGPSKSPQLASSNRQPPPYYIVTVQPRAV